MKKHLWIALVTLAMILPACSEYSVNSVDPDDPNITVNPNNPNDPNNNVDPNNPNNNVDPNNPNNNIDPNDPNNNVDPNNPNNPNNNVDPNNPNNNIDPNDPNNNVDPNNPNNPNNNVDPNNPNPPVEKSELGLYGTASVRCMDSQTTMGGIIYIFDVQNSVECQDYLKMNTEKPYSAPQAAILNSEFFISLSHLTNATYVIEKNSESFGHSSCQSNDRKASVTWKRDGVKYRAVSGNVSINGVIYKDIDTWMMQEYINLDMDATFIVDSQEVRVQKTMPIYSCGALYAGSISSIYDSRPSGE